jgi:hypothetical protein
VAHKSHVSHRAYPLLVPTHVSPALYLVPARRLLLLPPSLLVTKQFGTCAMELDRRFTAIKDAGAPGNDSPIYLRGTLIEGIYSRSKRTK